MKNNKNLLIVLAALGLGAAIYFLAKGKKGGNGGNGNGGGVTPPPPSQQDELRWRKMANEFFEAFNGCGTTNNIVRSGISKITSEADWQGVIRAYGTKTTTSSFWCIGNSDFTGGLLDTLNDECSSGEIDEYNTILSSKGVTTLIPN
jgi:hypothetical protein